MEDDFLTQYYEPPRPEFAAALRAKLVSLEPRPSLSLRRLLSCRRSLQTIGLAVVALGLIGACVRAVFRPRYVQISDLIWVYETKATPEYHFPEGFSCATPVGPIPTPTYVSVEQARELVSVPLRAPTWAPEGFRFQGIYVPGREAAGRVQASMSWLNESGEYISLFVWSLEYGLASQPARIQPFNVDAPPDRYEKVEVKGEPAVLLRGRWGYACDPVAEPGAWTDKGLQLIWVEDGVQYTLSTLADFVSAEDLIRMANSSE